MNATGSVTTHENRCQRGCHETVTVRQARQQNLKQGAYLTLSASSYIRWLTSRRTERYWERMGSNAIYMSRSGWLARGPSGRPAFLFHVKRLRSASVALNVIPPFEKTAPCLLLLAHGCCVSGIAIHPLLHLLQKMHRLSERPRCLFSQRSLLMGLSFTNIAIQLVFSLTRSTWEGIDRVLVSFVAVPSGYSKNQQG